MEVTAKLESNFIMEREDRTNLVSFYEGDDAAFTAIYNKYIDALYTYGIGLGFDEEMVKDALQDVFCCLLCKPKSLKDVINLKHYLFRMVKNKLFDLCKTKMVTYDIQDYECCFFTNITILDRMVNVEEKIAIQEKIKNMMACLTGRQREALYLRFIQEMKYEEIAELLDMTPQAARKLISRGVNRIREEDLCLLIYFFSLSQYV